VINLESYVSLPFQQMLSDELELPVSLMLIVEIVFVGSFFGTLNNVFCGFTSGLFH